MAHRNRFEINKDKTNKQFTSENVIQTTSWEVTSIIDDWLLDGEVVADLLREESGKKTTHI